LTVEITLLTLTVIVLGWAFIDVIELEIIMRTKKNRFRTHAKITVNGYVP